MRRNMAWICVTSASELATEGTCLNRNISRHSVTDDQRRVIYWITVFNVMHSIWVSFENPKWCCCSVFNCSLWMHDSFYPLNITWRKEFHVIKQLLGWSHKSKHARLNKAILFENAKLLHPTKLIFFFSNTTPTSVSFQIPNPTRVTQCGNCVADNINYCVQLTNWDFATNSCSVTFMLPHLWKP